MLLLAHQLGHAVTGTADAPAVPGAATHAAVGYADRWRDFARVGWMVVVAWIS